MIARFKEYFFWYDLETTGTNPKRDRIMEFAGILTDSNLEPVNESIHCFIKLPDEIIPHPEASCITGLSPTRIQTEGISEFECIQEVKRILSRGNVCICGYNNANFDDQFLRYACYRNLFSPYEHEYHDGNSRLDLFQLLRFAAAMRPSGLHWPEQDGKPSFKLENIAAANGLQTKDAHLASADVRNTLDLARLLKTAQPKLWDFVYQNRSKPKLKALTQPWGKTPFLYLRRYRRDTTGFLGVGVAIAQGEYANSILGIDLTTDIQLLESATADELHALTFASREEREQQNLPDSPLFNLALNQCPIVAPLAALTPSDSERLGISRSLIHTNLGRLAKLRNLPALLKEVYTRPPDETEPFSVEPPIAEEQLYGYDFVSNIDLALGTKLHKALASHAPVDSKTFKWSETRTANLAQRLLAHERPDSLDAEQTHNYRDFVIKQLMDSEMGLEARLQQVTEAKQTYADANSTQILDDLTQQIQKLRAKYAL